MKSSGQIDLVINGGKFKYRAVSPDDVSLGYVEALRDAKEYLTAVSDDLDIDKQKEYVESILNSSNDILLGLFEQDEIIGTSGVQNLIFGGPSSVGVLVIGSRRRGAGFGKTLVWSACSYVSYYFGQREFLAGVRKDNSASMRTFVSCGFEVCEDNGEAVFFSADAANIIKPDIIESVQYVK